MLAHTANQEIEIKLRLPSAAAGRRLLARAGFRVVRRRTFEANTVFDTEARALRAAGSLLRVRSSGRLAVLTFKGPSGQGKYKCREEREVELSDRGAFEQILLRLGFDPVFRYEKYRTEYAEPARAGLITLDETPIGNFLELEGRPRWIDRTARRLGYAEADYITASYAGLYLAHREENLDAPADMVFPRRAPTSARGSSHRAASHLRLEF